jgi:hypothetical protein
MDKTEQALVCGQHLLINSACLMGKKKQATYKPIFKD